MTDWRKLVGKRVLLEEAVWERILEAVVVEVSPSCKYVKLKYPKTGYEEWVEATDYELVEVLR